MAQSKRWAVMETKINARLAVSVASGMMQLPREALLWQVALCLAPTCCVPRLVAVAGLWIDLETAKFCEEGFWVELECVWAVDGLLGLTGSTCSTPAARASTEVACVVTNWR